MRKIFFSLLVFLFVFSFGIYALADEGDSHEMDQNMDHDMGNMDHDMDSMEHDMGNMDHDMDSMDHDMGHTGDSDTDGAHTEASAHHHGKVVETPPNYKVLGTYGAVNLSFILIGVRNKWIRRKVK